MLPAIIVYANADGQLDYFPASFFKPDNL